MSITPSSNELLSALRSVRRAKTFWFVVVLVCLLGQLTLFFAYKYIAPSVEAPPPTGTRVNQAIDYLVGVARFVAMTGSIVWSMVLLLIVNMVLVGRIGGLGRAATAWIISIMIIVLVFPWQAILEPYDFKIPGVMYGWQELRELNHHEEPDVLIWARFVVFPAMTVLLALAGQAISAVGLRQSLKAP